MSTDVIIIGGGLAGCEAAWQAAEKGCRVRMYEMRPTTMTPAHSGGGLAELVCSNSLRAAGLQNAVGLMKEEMRLQNSLIMTAADCCKVPAGGALAVDRDLFSRFVGGKIINHPNIDLITEEIVELMPLIEESIVVVAAGPLCSPALAKKVADITGNQQLFFFDAVAPLVEADSIDMSIAWKASRYDKGEAEYINCPLDEEQYEQFWQALVTAETVAMKDFENNKVFEGCMPIEVMAQRGRETMRFGPLKPVGLPLPNSGKLAHAVVQLRQDNVAATLYNMVGFQTHLTWPEQRLIFRMIPGLEQAEFARLGVMHRNTFINSPHLLLNSGQLRGCEKVLFAGQITGVEGYVESAASGLMVGINAARLAKDRRTLVWPDTTAHGALQNYITQANGDNFQPMNINFSLLPPLVNFRGSKVERRKKLAERALQDLEKFKNT